MLPSARPAKGVPPAHGARTHSRPKLTMQLRTRFLALQAHLETCHAYWRPAPFHDPQPAWCAEHPALAAAALALDDDTLEHHGAAPEEAAAWLSSQLPVLHALNALSTFPPCAVHALPPLNSRLHAEVPGRKKAQIDAFVAHLPTLTGPVLEWCAGKGHLGRRLHHARGVAVEALEIDPGLCAEAARLAARQGLPQAIVEGDATSPDTLALVRDRDVLALHACGELHRQLVRTAADNGARSLHIAPCCYAHGVTHTYRPLSQEAALTLDRNALRLAVTETVTAPLHDRRRLARDQAWKLGFTALRAALDEGRGDPAHSSRAFRPVPAAWLKADFAHFCTQLAAREGVQLPSRVDWPHWEQLGVARRDQVRRLELVRHAFRRPIEVWLALDLALGLEERGFDVSLGAFCARTLTPRNLLISAHRRM